MSQETLAGILHVSRELVSKWENGQRRPDWSAIENIAAALGTESDRIVDKSELIFDDLSECIPEGKNITEEKLTELLNGFLRKISKREARFFIYRYYFLKNVSEISAELGARENYVRSVISKTRRKFGKYIKEELA